MAKKKNKKSAKPKSAAKQQSSKKSALPLMVIALLLVGAAIAAVIFGGGFGGDPGTAEGPPAPSPTPVQSETDPLGEEQEQTGPQEITDGGYLNIPTAELSSTASFFPFILDGTQMEVFAVKASDGTIRTAFNTCQSCYTSGKGYYIQQGTDLVCQNCGFHFSPDQVEIQTGGCNPWPIFAENKTVSEDSIQIFYDFLKQSAAIFANWKR